MPIAPRFQHQQYHSSAPTSPHHLIAPAGPTSSVEIAERWRAVGAAYRAAGVAAIYVMPDGPSIAIAGRMLAALASQVPAATEVARRVQRHLAPWANAVDRDTSLLAREFERSINEPGLPRIPVRLCDWSRENNHLGRADAAVRLIAKLAAHKGRRVMIWGYGHAGNALALLTHLVNVDRAGIDEFFAAAEVYYRWPILGCLDIPLWRHVHALLAEPNALAHVSLDLVTFGTPILYGWNGYKRLLHFVFHRPVAGLPAYQAPFPPAAERLLQAADGDYVQQLGVAGTNEPPSVFAWRARLAERRLDRLLQAGLSNTSLADRLRAGTRVADSGTTLLVDYGLPRGTLREHDGGHAVYARREWLLFHAGEVAQRLYDARRSSAA